MTYRLVSQYESPFKAAVWSTRLLNLTIACSILKSATASLLSLHAVTMENDKRN